MTDQLTQHDLAVKVMFVKGENLRKSLLRRRNKLLLSPDGTPAYLVEKDRVGAPYKVFKDVSLYGNVRQR